MKLMRSWISCVMLLLTFTAARAQLNPDVDRDTTKWFNRTQSLSGVEVTVKRRRYSRKNNPAVELMRKVIAAKNRYSPANHDYYQYHKYTKMKLALNDMAPSMLESPKLKKRQWLLDQLEVCPYNNKLILPVLVDETVTQHLFRRQPHTERVIVEGRNQTGVNDLFQTGDILNALMKDVFADVNIRDDQIWLLRHKFISPIGSAAIGFYRYYIEDTLYVGSNKCYHLSFLPDNSQDFGFRGELYVMADSTWQVKSCQMTIPNQGGVNFVDNMTISQEFRQLPDSTWVLSTGHMFAELALVDFLQTFAVVRTTRLTDHAFSPLQQQLFTGKKKEVTDINATTRDNDYWNHYRQGEFTKAESGMKQFLNALQRIKGFSYLLWVAKAFIENFVETSTDKNHPSKVDIGPVNTTITHNFIDGLRLRLSAQTTANLDSNLFLSGYIARGFDSHKTYYRGDVTWSFNKKEYLPREFPKRTLTFTSTYDVMSPSDKFLRTDKDNVFTSFKWTTVDKMMFYNRQTLTFEREEDWGFSTILAIKTEENEAAGNLYFTPLASTPVPGSGFAETPQHDVTTATAPGTLLPSSAFRTTEMSAQLRIAPGETYINTKQRRMTVNRNIPVFTIGHTVGIKRLLGGQYNYNLTEVSIFKRFWPGSWGKVDCTLKGAIQWQQVPFPLLIMPETNLSYIIQANTFELVNNMEFLSDRYASAIVNWDLGGKLLNRIPLLRRLKWRERFTLRALYGQLTDKNNPQLEQNHNSPLLMAFPEGAYTLQPDKPYWEAAVGIYNILKVFHVEYVRRLNYNHLPTAHKHGVRATLNLTF